MVEYKCDGCGVPMEKGSLRYTVTIDVRAAYDELQVGLMDLVRDHREEILRLIEQLRDRSATEVEEQVYKQITLDLCPPCQQTFIKNPLRFHPERPPGQDAVDIDAFLRSLGYGPSKDA